LESLDDIVENYKSPMIEERMKKDSSATMKRSVLSYKHSATSNHSSIMQLQNENFQKNSKSGSGKFNSMSDNEKTFKIEKIQIDNNLNDTNQNSFNSGSELHSYISYEPK